VAKTHKVTIKEWNSSITAFYDPSDTAQTAMVVGAEVTVHLLSEGDTAGDIDSNGTASITALERSNDIEGIVVVSITLQGNGVLAHDAVSA